MEGLARASPDTDMDNATLQQNKRRSAPVDPAQNFLAVPEVRIGSTAITASDKADGQIDVELRLHGKRFVFRFDIPDALGAVMVTDVDRQRMLDRVMRALDGHFGKIRLRAEL